MDEPLISIIVPVYNVEQYVKQCVLSLIKQSYHNLQILLVNDGSEDNSLRVINTLAEKDSRIEIINQKNAGVSEARNTGLNAAKGDFILFVDGDDWLDLMAVQESYRCIQEENADIVLWSYIREYQTKSVPKRLFDQDFVVEGENIRSQFQRRIIGLIDDELAHPDRADVFSPVWGKLYRAEIIKDILFPDIRQIGSFEDGLFNFQAFERAEKVVCLNREWYHYRKTNTATVTAFRPETEKQWEQLLDVMQRLLDSGNYGIEFSRAFQNRVCVSLLSKAMILARSNLNIVEQTRTLRRQLLHERCQNAFNNFQFSQMPLYWRLFFGLCKKKLSFAAMMMANGMSILVQVIG